MTGAYARFLVRLESTRALGVSLGLDRVQAVLRHMGSPERKFAAVQIAGTNGKGSTAAMTESILRVAGLRTGLYTSPHLSRFTERIRIAGLEVDGDRLAHLDDAVAEAVAATGTPLTYFEVATVLAFLCMAEEKVDVAVLETGLGGRLDAVTACQPVATAITSVGWDHTEFLGNTLADIAREKAGIVRAGVPLLLGRLQREAYDEIARQAARAGAPVRRLGTDFFPPVPPPALLGAHQIENAAIAAALAREVGASLGIGIHEGTVAAGLAGVVWPGRLEWVAPDVLLDCAHNIEGAVALAAALAVIPAFRPGRTNALVVSIVRGKGAAQILRTLAPLFGLVVVTRSRSDRALGLQEMVALARQAAGAHVQILAVAGPARALAEARAFARRAGGGTVVSGSIFLVGQLRAALLGEPVDPGETAASDPLP